MMKRIIERAFHWDLGLRPELIAMLIPLDGRLLEFVLQPDQLVVHIEVRDPDAPEERYIFALHRTGDAIPETRAYLATRECQEEVIHIYEVLPHGVTLN